MDVEGGLKWGVERINRNMRRGGGGRGKKGKEEHKISLISTI